MTSNKKSWVMLGSGLVLIVISVGLLVIGPKKATPQAKGATTENYTELWSVNDWINIRYTGGRHNFPNPTVVSIGPYKWGVNGSLGSVTYTETWTVDPPGTSVLNENAVLNHGDTDWGNINNDIKYEINGSEFPWGNFVSAQNDQDGLVALGSYGWMLGSNSADSTWISSWRPKVWRVTGEIRY